jgi:hypothetical protein
MTKTLHGRLTTGLASLYLLTTLSVGPAGAVDEVATGDQSGQMICANCKPNTQTKAGNAVSGSVTDNGNGSANASMVYSVPNDGDTYSGTSEVVVKDASGATVLDITGSAWDAGTGGLNTTGLNGIYVPVGGSVYINIIESNTTGTKGFSGSYHLQNYQPVS